jgi:uncharacterized protein YkwD
MGSKGHQLGPVPSCAWRLEWVKANAIARELPGRASRPSPPHPPPGARPRGRLRASDSGSVVPRNRLVLALVVALLAVMAAPARATVHRANRRQIPARHIPSACPDTALQPNQGNISLIRAAILCLVNRERADRGERPLVPDARLQRAAQAHSESMALHSYFEHDGPQRETPLSRIRATGYISSARIGYEVGENIGWGTLWEGAPRAIVEAWMASPGHRANILDAYFRDSAVGVSPHLPSSLARGQAGAIYTEDFGDLR